MASKLAIAIRKEQAIGRLLAAAKTLPAPAPLDLDRLPKNPAEAEAETLERLAGFLEGLALPEPEPAPVKRKRSA